MQSIDWHKTDDSALAALPATIEKAEAGDAHARRRLLDLFCACVDSGRAPYPALLAYLARHFAEALAAKGGATMLGRTLLGGPPNARGAPELVERDQIFALEVHEMILAGKSAFEAIQDVAETHHEGVDVVKRAWARFKEADFIKGWPSA